MRVMCVCWIPILRLPHQIPLNVNVAMKQRRNVKTLHGIAYCDKKPNAKICVFILVSVSYFKIFSNICWNFFQNCSHCSFCGIKLVKYFFLLLCNSLENPFFSSSLKFFRPDVIHAFCLLIIRVSSDHQSTYGERK